MNPSAVYPANTTKRDSADDILSSFLDRDDKTKLDNFLLNLNDDSEPLDAFPTNSVFIDVEQEHPDAVLSSTNDDELLVMLKPVLFPPPIDFGSIKPLKKFPRRVSEESTSTVATEMSTVEYSSSSRSYDEDEHDEVLQVIVLGPYDVLCGREAQAWNNEGNQRFRLIISDNVQRYMDAPTTPAKTAVIKSVVRQVQGEKGQGRFIKQGRDGSFVRELTKRETHHKVGHAIRDLVKQLQRRDGSEDLEYTNQPQRALSLVSSSTTSTAAKSTTVTVEEDDVWGMKFYHLENE